MKKVLLMLFLLPALLAGAQMKAKMASMKEKSDTKTVLQSHSLRPVYSTKISIGNPDHAKIVLDLWQSWNDNMIDYVAGNFADTVSMMFHNGEVIRGRDSVLIRGKQMRNGYTSLNSTVDVVLPLRSLDRKEDWVSIWGTEESTDIYGNVSRVHYNEIWRINKDGKVDFMRQYRAVPLTKE